MPAPPSSVSRDEPWRKARGTQVLGMMPNGTVSRSPATSELAALVALAYPDPMPSSEKPLRVKPARRPRKRPAPSAAKVRREQRVTSEQALRRALRVSPLPDKLETKPMKLQSLYQAWARVAHWAKSNLRHPSGLPAWKRRQASEPSHLVSPPSSSSVRTRTKATKSALKSGKTSKKRGKDARGN